MFNLTVIKLTCTFNRIQRIKQRFFINHIFYTAYKTAEVNVYIPRIFFRWVLYYL